MTETIVQIVSFVFCAGITYGAVNNRLKHIEKELNDQHNIVERLTRIEEQTKFIIEKINK